MGFYIFISVFILLLVMISVTKKGRSVENINAVCSEANDEYSSVLVSVAFFISMCFLCIITGARSINIGNDTSNYVEYFLHISEFGVNKKFQIELGYQYFCLLISKISDNPHVFLAIYSI